MRKNPPVLFWGQGNAHSKGTHETDWRGNKLPRDERLATDLALILSVAAIIIIEIVVGSATEGQTVSSGMDSRCAAGPS